ncbi:MAG TPA: hypothetical protein VFZ17_05495 [Acidimicrobiia bacterium]|nr:hypothetical protein [Acidimicrobiia bacterium]
MSTVRRCLTTLVVTATVVAALAAPAGATPILADDDYKWFYWVGPLLVLSFIGLLIAIGIGYYIKVLRPKRRGRPVT